MLLNVRDAKKNETESSLHQKASKEGGSAPPQPTSARCYCSVPDLRNSSSLSCSGLKLGQLISRIRETKSASARNTFTGTVPLTSVESSESTTQPSDSPECLLSTTLTTSSECSSPEMDKVVSLNCEQQQIPQYLLQEKTSNISLPTRSQHFLGTLYPSGTLLKNSRRKKRMMAELLSKVQLREKLLLPAPHNSKLVSSGQSQNSSLPQECYLRNQSSGEKRPLDMSSLVLLKGSRSRDVSLENLLVVATSARLDLKPGRNHTGAMRDPCVQDQEAYGHCLVSGQRGCEKN